VPPTGERPTVFIPKVDAKPDETVYIPKVEDFGAVSQGRSGGFADAEDAFRPRQGSIDLGPPAGRRPGPPPPARPPVPPPGRGADPTEVHNWDTTTITDLRAEAPPAAGKETGRTVARTVGEVLITLGMVCLLFVVYELYITNIFAAQKQANATTALNKEWDTVTGLQRTSHYDLSDGHGFAKIYIPSFGADYVFTIVEGVTQPDLAIGPGHYPGSALPGQPGDMAVAGHRVSEGAPFDNLNLVQSCDAIVIETSSDWYVYRLLPMKNEVAGWATGKGKTAQCSGPNGEAPVKPLGGLYAQTVGQEIVLPSEGDVVAPIPHHVGAKVPQGQMVSLLTLTTCNPKFSSTQRMILHAVLVKDWRKSSADPTKLPPEMKETS
jgi:sortase (surface protein transpeptidase)